MNQLSLFGDHKTETSVGPVSDLVGTLTEFNEFGNPLNWRPEMISLTSLMNIGRPDKGKPIQFMKSHTEHALKPNYLSFLSKG